GWSWRRCRRRRRSARGLPAEFWSVERLGRKGAQREDGGENRAAIDVRLELLLAPGQVGIREAAREEALFDGVREPRPALQTAPFVESSGMLERCFAAAELVPELGHAVSGQRAHGEHRDRKSTRLNSSHVKISY